jgi:hypothetical protein
MKNCIANVQQKMICLFGEIRFYHMIYIQLILKRTFLYFKSPGFA